MKKTLSLLALTISFSVNAQISTNGTNNSGMFASAMGDGASATGPVSLAMGYYTQASGYVSTAIGYQPEANGIASVSVGHLSIANGDYSTAIGYSQGEEYIPEESTPFYKNEALGNYSVVLGNRNKSTGVKSFSFGNDNLSQGTAAFSIGENNISTGNYSMALGLFSESIANASFAIGNNAYADGYNTIAIGSANTIDENASADAWSINNRLLVVGNGQYNQETETLERSDAFTIMFNGDATLAGNLSVNSDAKLKSNIVSLGSTLAKVLILDGKSYNMKNDPENSVQIGLVAQNIEQVFPELVSDSNGIKSVNYQGLIPVLINAVKEQDEIIKKQDERLAKLEQVIANMNE